MTEEWVVIGDEAWTPEDLCRATARWETRERRRAYDRAYRAAHREQRQAWVSANREKKRAYDRASAGRKRASETPEQAEKRRSGIRRAREQYRLDHPLPHRVGALHALRCTGPTRATGCRCTKVSVYEVAA